jgi:VanZ family protein
MRRIFLHPLFWLGGFALWFGVLWLLSANTLRGMPQPKVSHFDKIAHFGFFFGGTCLLCAWLFRLNPEKPKWKLIICIAVVVIGLVGWLDEYHQTFTIGRRGNDPSDWLADFAGAIVGALIFKKFHHRLK